VRRPETAPDHSSELSGCKLKCECRPQATRPPPPPLAHTHTHTHTRTHTHARTHEHTHTHTHPRIHTSHPSTSAVSLQTYTHSHASNHSHSHSNTIATQATGQHDEGAMASHQNICAVRRRSVTNRSTTTNALPRKWATPRLCTPTPISPSNVVLPHTKSPSGRTLHELAGVGNVATEGECDWCAPSNVAVLCARASSAYSVRHLAISPLYSNLPESTRKC
jgi:hypothetical protein